MLLMAHSELLLHISQQIAGKHYKTVKVRCFVLLTGRAFPGEMAVNRGEGRGTAGPLGCYTPGTSSLSNSLNY